MHPRFRKRVINEIEAAVRKYDEAKDETHKVLQGRAREIAVESLIEPILPAGVGIGRGKVVDCLGSESAECDVIIYDKEMLRGVMHDDKEGLFPVESTIAVIEVKSTSNATEMKDLCEIVAGDELHGGDGTDTLWLPTGVGVADLENLGAIIDGIEAVEVLEGGMWGEAECELNP